MDAFLARLSYHATSYAVRSCIALTSSYVIKQGSKLLQNVDHDPLRIELAQLQRRLSRKIELISPILESIELRYTRGDSALATIVRTARGLRDDIDALGERLKNATTEKATPQGKAKDSKTSDAQRAEIVAIMGDIKELITSIDDAIPLINLWVSAIGGFQSHSQPPSFSPSRLLQASMLVNVGDTQFILDPSQPMQIGPDFTLSLYMLFRGHASTRGDEEEEKPYGVEEGQRKPMWQEVIHKARVRLLRVPLDNSVQLSNESIGGNPCAYYSYQLQLVEDLEDGRLHIFDDKDEQPAPYDGLLLAGIRELIPVHQIAKMFYADVGKILNINNDEGASRSPVLLLKRDINAIPVYDTPVAHPPHDPIPTIEGVEEDDGTHEAGGDTQVDIDSQLRREMGLDDEQYPSSIQLSEKSNPGRPHQGWTIPQDLDPEWIALEVFDLDEDDDDSESSCTMDDENEPTSDNEEPTAGPECRPRHVARPSMDQNLITQLNRMSVGSSRPSSRDSQSYLSPAPVSTRDPSYREITPDPDPTVVNGRAHTHLSPTTLMERSPFGAIKTSLSLLEMLLRLTTLQEFEQTTHLAIPDHVLKFYLDESASTSGLSGQDRRKAANEAERKVGFDPYIDPS